MSEHRARLLARAKAASAAVTPEEDAAILADALRDPDNPPARKPRGRPPALIKKEPVMLRLDPEVLTHFRRQGDGWQTRINAALRRVAGLK